MKHYKLVGFLSNLNANPPLHECKAPRTNVTPPNHDFLATVLLKNTVVLSRGGQ